MKKLLIILLALCLLVCFAACGDKEKEPVLSDSQPTASDTGNAESNSDTTSSEGGGAEDGAATAGRWTDNY